MSSDRAPRPGGAAAVFVPLRLIAERLGLDPAVVLGSARSGGPAELVVSGVTHDSTDVRRGDLFAALPGARHHGAEFVADAIARGAVAVLTDQGGVESAAQAGVSALVVDDPRSVLGLVSALVYGSAGDALLTLGITGTNGKTTTAHMVHAALSGMGRSAGLIGTIETRVGDEVFASARTTPESTDLQALLAVMRERGADSVVMEVSSIALRMGRVDGLVLDVAGFTNLTQDHLDFHDDMEDYFAAKAELFTPLRALRGVVLVDDVHGRRLASTATIPIVTASTDGAEADWRATDIEVRSDGRTDFTLEAPGSAPVRTTVLVPGRFNVANALLAVAMLVEGGVDLAAAVVGVAGCTGVPGRMESVAQGQPFVAVVDYAHTPAAVGSILAGLRQSAEGRLLMVLGCGGDRDADKRPLMGEAGARDADLLVITDDNPRSEDPASIRAAMRAGADAVPREQRAEVLEIGDRVAAIRAAVERAQPGDVVVVAGKGHEQGQEVAGIVTPFDDRIVLREAIAAVRP